MLLTVLGSSLGSILGGIASFEGSLTCEYIIQMFSQPPIFFSLGDDSQHSLAFCLHCPHSTVSTRYFQWSRN